MTEDNPIIEEVRRVRDHILARYDGDLRALLTDAQRRTEQAARAGKRVIAPSKRLSETSVDRTTTKKAS